MLYTLSGKGLLNYLDKKYVLGPGQAAVLYCEHYHRYETHPPDGWDFKWFHFSGTAAKEHYRLLNQNAFSVISVKEPVAFEKTIDRLFSSPVPQDISASVNTSMLITQIISRLITHQFDGGANPRQAAHKEEIDAVIRYIFSNYQSKIDIDDMTKTVYMSKYHFLRLFKSHMGISPYDFLIHYRISKAKELLKTTDCSVGDICNMTGFHDYNHFIRTFKKTVGTTPAKYRSNA